MAGIEVKSVLGHMCDGLRASLDESTYECIPFIQNDGKLKSCDGSIDLAIVFCPFCGARLRETPSEWPTAEREP